MRRSSDGADWAIKDESDGRQMANKVDDDEKDERELEEAGNERRESGVVVSEREKPSQTSQTSRTSPKSRGCASREAGKVGSVRCLFGACGQRRRGRASRASTATLCFELARLRAVDCYRCSRVGLSDRLYRVGGLLALSAEIDAIARAEERDFFLSSGYT
jgi:hypothetical protein